MKQIVLVDRNDIRFRYNPIKGTYQILVNAIEEVDSKAYKFKGVPNPITGTPAYTLQSFELIETDYKIVENDDGSDFKEIEGSPLTGIIITRNGRVACNEFIEGELE